MNRVYTFLSYFFFFDRCTDTNKCECVINHHVRLKILVKCTKINIQKATKPYFAKAKLFS